MFEKEAEEIANKKLCSERICYNHCNFNSPKHHRCGEWHRIYECAKESAEFGYNKANEWHYVKDKDYPKDKSKVLCIISELEDSYCEIGYHSQVETQTHRWIFEDYIMKDKSKGEWGVIAWKEIVLPELKESK